MVCESLQVRLQDTTVDEKNGFAQIYPLQICRKNVKPWVNIGSKDDKYHIGTLKTAGV